MNMHKWAIFLLIPFLVLGFYISSGKKLESNRNPAADDDLYLLKGSNYLNQYSLKESKDPSFQNLMDINKKNRPEKLVDFIKIIKKLFPGYFNKYTLAYESLSQQKASFENPRVIVFGDTARLVIAYNGHPLQKGFGSLETMEYIDDRGFIFRELGFVKEGYVNDLPFAEIDQSLSSENLIVSVSNPSKCFSCHDTTFANPRPIFEKYRVWPGFYGSDDDYVFRARIPRRYGVSESAESKLLPTSLSRMYRVVNKDIEREALVDFIKGNKKVNERYVVLGNYIESTLVPSELLPNDQSRIPENRINLRFTFLLTNLAIKKMASDIVENKELMKSINSFIALLKCDESMFSHQSAKDKALDFFPRHFFEGKRKFKQEFQSVKMSLRKSMADAGLENTNRMWKILNPNIEAGFDDVRSNCAEEKKIFPNMTDYECRTSGFVDEETLDQYTYIELFLRRYNMSFKNWSIGINRDGSFDYGTELQGPMKSLANEIALKTPNIILALKDLDYMNAKCQSIVEQIRKASTYDRKD